MNFIPEQPKNIGEVPFFEDVNSTDGWMGQTTTKSIETLKSEITSAISHLGGMVVGFQRGTFLLSGKNREGFRIHCTIDDNKGKLIPIQVEIAALPVKETVTYRRGGMRSKEHRQDASLRMSLFMFRDAIRGLWFLQQLSPGYAPLMPFILVGKNQTLSQLWSESPIMSKLLPQNVGDGEFIDAEVKVISPEK